VGLPNKTITSLARVALFLLACTLLSAQPEGIALRHITTDDGLAHNVVNCIAKDTQGFIWFGTADGLTRFDGKRCLSFRASETDTTALPSGQIMGLSLDPLGHLWVSTAKGLCEWDYAGHRFRRQPLYAPGRADAYKIPIWGFAFNKTGTGYAFAADTFMARFDYRKRKFSFGKISFRQYTSNQVTTYVDSKDRIWLSISGHLFLCVPEKASYILKLGFSRPEAALKTHADRLAEDEQGRLWCSTWDKGFFMLNEQTGEFEDFPDGDAAAAAFLFDRRPMTGQFIWAGGGSHGLYWLMLADSSVAPFARHLREPFSHNNTTVRCIFKDDETGIVWLGTEFGVEKYDPNDLKFTRLMLPDEDGAEQFNGVTGIVEDRKNPGRYWVAVSGKGLFEWKRRQNNFKRIDPATGLKSTDISGIVQDKNGNIWLAEPGCAQVFEPAARRFRTVNIPFFTAGIPHKVVRILEGKDGRMWFGTNHDGLFWHDPASGRVGHVAFDGRPRYIRALNQDDSGRLLIGLSNGFFRYDPATDAYEHFLKKDSLTYFCTDFAFDQQNRLWVATTEGLFLLDDSSRVKFALTNRNGLQNKEINGLEVDLEGRLWLATSNGLYRFYPPTGVVNVYGRPDGLFDTDIDAAFQTMPRGELFVGFRDAFNLANLSRLPMNPHPPRVVLTDVLVLNKPAPWRAGEPVVLKPGENVVTFDFSAVNFTQPEKTVLSYKLEGFDQDWAETQQNLITYTNLDGGDYTLLVRARNGDGIWSADVARVPLRVVPPFTRTMWFRVLMLASLGGVITFVSWYRREQRHRLEEIRQRIARDLHDDMGSTLSSIRFFSEVAHNQLPEDHAPTKTLLQRISQSATTLSEAMQDIVWAINARHDNLEDLAARMREFGLKIGEARNIRFSADIPASFPLRHLRPDQRRNIYLIFKEAVNNAAKYSGCTEIGVNMMLSGRKLTLEIKDNGKGFDPQTVQPGNGLSNMRLRAADIKGTLDVQTSPENGVRILLEVEV